MLKGRGFKSPEHLPRFMFSVRSSTFEVRCADVEHDLRFNRVAMLAV